MRTSNIELNEEPPKSDTWEVFEPKKRGLQLSRLRPSQRPSQRRNKKSKKHSTGWFGKVSYLGIAIFVIAVIAYSLGYLAEGWPALCAQIVFGIVCIAAGIFTYWWFVKGWRSRRETRQAENVAVQPGRLILCLAFILAPICLLFGGRVCYNCASDMVSGLQTVSSTVWTVKIERTGGRYSTTHYLVRTLGEGANVKEYRVSPSTHNQLKDSLAHGPLTINYWPATGIVESISEQSLPN
ncbi:hypothetical protein KIMH_14530 [Bombiscardovia apis]|uniref:DUF3592 domain-containing protein n=1 Tax=Bombiscardovia apis TaxID=2932182 RepID=A0ABN6SJ13_9BIFI|nr:hypothetical protein [Bombiscardovia apis]BDR55342.1 hypothetical protein KIMH_14530 [Bombiscardovia apis]